MRNKRRWLARAAACVGLGLTGLSGCQTWAGGMTLPSGRYLHHYPQYLSADPAFPLPRELASQEDPDGAARRIGGQGIGPGPVAPGAPVPVPGRN
jgi:hypothetical protein